MAQTKILHVPKLLLRIFMLIFLVLLHVNAQYYEGRRLKPCELETLLRDLAYPDEKYEMHAAALRNQLRDILEHDSADNYHSVHSEELDSGRGPYEDKRSYQSLLRDGTVFGKRNVGALARAGLLRNQPDYLKRSLATLAKNGQLPTRDVESEESTPDGEWNEDKRNVASAFKSGYIVNGKRNIAALARKYELPGKRNIQSLLRSGMLPSIAPKRNMKSIDSALAEYEGMEKRNIQTLVRGWSLPKQQNKLSEGTGSTSDAEKRNIQSLKNAQGYGIKKRELYYDDMEASSPEELEPVHQTAPLDYEELLNAMSKTYPLYDAGNHVDQKRFLASLTRNGTISRYSTRFLKRNNAMSEFHANAALSSPAGQMDGAAFNPDTVTKKMKFPLYSNEEDEAVIGSTTGTTISNERADDARKNRITAGFLSRTVPGKRHLASIVRSGWSPSFRSSSGSRFSRAGRARSNFTPDQSLYDSQPTPYVDNASEDSEVPSGGGLPKYSPRGMRHRPNFLHYTGEAFVNRPYVYDDFIKESIYPFYTEDDYRCASRLRKLLYYLKQQYYRDSKFIQAVYGETLPFYT